MKNKILIMLLAPLLLLTGCANDNDFVNKVIMENKPELGYYSELPKEVNEITGYMPGSAEFIEIYHILKDSQYGEKIEFSEDRLYINSDDYIFLMDDEQIKNGFEQAGFKVGVEQMEAAEQAIKENSDAWYANVQVGNCNVLYRDEYILIRPSTHYISEDVIYLANLYQKDGWYIVQGARNSVLDTLTMHYWTDEDKEDDIVNSICLYLYGRDNELKEIEIKFSNINKEIPKDCYPTISECLKTLGCTEEFIDDMLNELPEKSGNTGDIEYIVDFEDAKNGSIKFFVR